MLGKTLVATKTGLRLSESQLDRAIRAQSDPHFVTR